jgi:4-amino-4-deoxychorismate lyase
VKLLLTRGEATARGYGTSGAERPTRVVLRYRVPAPPIAAGVRVRLGTLRFGECPSLAGIKHLNRLEQVLARREWNDPSVFESLHASSSGWLASGTMSNVFLVAPGRLRTPSLDLCGIAGVMRSVVLDCAHRAGLAVEVGRIAFEELALAQEVFLTNVRIGVVPVISLAGRPLAVGEATRTLQALAADAH